VPDPPVWIVLPTYNGERFLPAALQSIAQQTYANWKLYLVDDGSRDGSAEICEEFSRRFRSRVLFERRAKNYGLRRTIERFYSLADEGNYLAFHAHDDVWFEDRLERAITALEREPETSLSFSEGQLIDEWGRPTGKLFSDLCSAKPAPKELARQIFFSGNCLCGPTVTVRGSWVKRLHLTIPRVVSCSTDYFTWLVLSSAAPVIFLEGSTAQYRLSREQLHRRNRVTQREDFWIPRLAWQRYPSVRALATARELKELEHRKADGYFLQRCSEGDVEDAFWWAIRLLRLDPEPRTVRRVAANLLQARRKRDKRA
jgi:glycosyltransferase involved in cell wall biosynthesis